MNTLQRDVKYPTSLYLCLHLVPRIPTVTLVGEIPPSVSVVSYSLRHTPNYTHLMQILRNIMCQDFCGLPRLLVP